MRTSRLGRRALLVAATLVFAWLARESGLGPLPDAPASSPSGARVDRSARVDRDARPRAPDPVEVAIAERRSGVVVTVDAVVTKRLADDREGDRHQRFLIRLASGRTLLVAHNLDLAERAPVREGESIRVKGEYVWNERGGLVHWTHRAPRGDHEGGWIEVGGRRIE